MANFNINRALNGVNSPLSYMGVNAQGVYAPSQTVTNNRAPTQNDSKNFILGCLWLMPSTATLPADNARIWMLTALIGNDATWTEIVASGANGVLTLTGNSGGAVGPLLGNINVIGGTGSGLSVVGNPGTNTLTITGTGGGSVINTILGDTGFVTGPTVAFFANLTAGETVLFEGDNATTMSFKVTDALSNTTMGLSSGSTGMPGIENTAFGKQTLANLNNVLGSQNSVLGMAAGRELTAGGRNTLLGHFAGFDMDLGSWNTAIGYHAGFNYAGSESYNILINNDGVLGENNTIRIGTNGGGAGQQNRCFVAGVNGVNVGAVATVVTEASNQLGTAVITAGTGITVTPGANTITIAGSGVFSLAYTNVNTSPYVVLTTDFYISVDCSGGPITIQLPNAATLGSVWVIKDRTGSCAANNITVTTVGGAVNIDGATTFVMNTAYESIQVIGNGTTYEVW